MPPRAAVSSLPVQPRSLRLTAVVALLAGLANVAAADSFSRLVGAGNDDAEQTLPAGVVDTGNLRLQLGVAGLVARIVGVRFVDIAIPRGANITGARIVFTADTADILGATFNIDGVASSSPDPFAASLFDLSDRARTTATVDWDSVPAWSGGASGSAQTTPELITIVQEIVDRGDWVPGGALAFLISGVGNRDARAYESGSGAARLEIEFDLAAAPEIVLSKTVSADADPVNGTSTPKAIPGATVRYRLTATNYGSGADPDSVTIVEPVPENTRLLVADIDAPGSGPVLFTDGVVAAGLSYTFLAAGHPLDSLDFSNNGGTSFDYVPTAAADGTDSAVTHIRISPSGTFGSAVNGNAPSFALEYLVVVD